MTELNSPETQLCRRIEEEVMRVGSIFRLRGHQKCKSKVEVEI